MRRCSGHAETSSNVPEYFQSILEHVRNIDGSMFRAGSTLL